MDDNNENKKPDKYLEKIDKQIDSIEQKIASMMENVDIEELTPAERMDFAIKFQSQLARFISLRKTSELATPEGRESTLMAVWMKQLRGEQVDG